jgi:hypothetical protein
MTLAPSFNRCLVPDTTHGEPLAKDACSNATQSSTYVTTRNGDDTTSNGSLALRYRCTGLLGCAAPGEQADVAINASANDVLKRSDGSDYTGQLELRLPLRITDAYNGASEAMPATVKDTNLSIAMPCAATDGPEGSSCAVTSSANAVMPGLVREEKRAAWQLGQVAFYDGGPDGVATTTTGNTAFMRQAIFVP